MSLREREDAHRRALKWMDGWPLDGGGAGRSLLQFLELEGQSLWWPVRTPFFDRHLSRAFRAIAVLDKLRDRGGAARLAGWGMDAGLSGVAAAWARARGVETIPLDAKKGKRRPAGFAAPTIDSPAGRMWFEAMRRMKKNAAKKIDRREGAAVFAYPCGDYLRHVYGEAVEQQAGRIHLGRIADALASRGGIRTLKVAQPYGPGRGWWKPMRHFGKGETPFAALVSAAALRRALKAHRGLIARWTDARNDGRSFSECRIAGVDASEFVREALDPLIRAELFFFLYYFEGLREWMERAKPAFLFVHDETAAFGFAAMRAGAAAGVPVYVMQREFIVDGQADYTWGSREIEAGRPEPDLTFVFGEYARKLLEKNAGRGAGKTTPVGNPVYDRRVVARGGEEIARLREKFGATGERKLILLLGQYILRENLLFLPAFFQAVAARKDVRLIVKPHPFEKRRGIYDEFLSRFEGIDAEIRYSSRFNDDLLYESIAAADAVVTRNSTATIDAVLMKVPAVNADFGDAAPMPFSEPPVIVAKAPEEIPLALDRALSQDVSAPGYLKERDAYLKKYLWKPGGGVCDRVADFIAERRGRTP